MYGKVCMTKTSFFKVTLTEIGDLSEDPIKDKFEIQTRFLQVRRYDS